MDRIQLRRDSSARWAEINPILLEGEVGYEIDTKLRKIGDGVNRWNDLEYLRAEGISQETGNSQNITMSQDAITRELSELGSEVYSNIFNNIVKYSSTAPDGTLRFNADIKEGKSYIAKVSYDSPVSTFQMGSSNTTGGYVDSTDVLSKISEYTFKFVSTADANSFVVYSIGATKMDFALFEDESIIERVDGIENSLKTEIKRTDSIKKEVKMDYTFAYNTSNMPTITKKEDDSYDVVFMAATYYIIHYGFGSINNLRLESETTYHVAVGQMLVYNIDNNVLEVVSAAINDGVKRLVLLRNYNLVIGEFESIIADEAKKQSVSNKTNIESIKSELYSITSLVDYSSTAPATSRVLIDIKKGKRYLAKVVYDAPVSIFQIGSANTDESGYVDSTEILSNISEYTFDFTASANANSLVVYSAKGKAKTMNLTLSEIVGVKEINDKADKLSRISVASEEYFQVPCNAQKSVSEKSFIESVDGGYILPTNKIYKDWCHFVMPNADAPLKLVILCHGSGLTVKENVDQWYNYQNIGKILISMGYAVLCCNFMPIDVGEAFYGSPLGNWMIPQIAKGAYDYVVNKYNIDTNGCFIYGQSNGGLTAENIVELTDIPVNAYALEVPNLSLQWGQMLVNPNPMRLFYGMSTSAKTPSTYEADKCVGLDPFTRNMQPPLIMSGDTLEEVNAFDWQSVQSCKFRKNIPILIQQSLHDNIVSHAMISAYARAIQNGGGYVKVITYDAPNVQHYIAEQTSKVGTIGIYNVRAAMYNNLSFFADFGGEKIEKVSLLPR